MRCLHIIHHGVIGPCRQLQMDADHSLVVDCGLFHGNGTSADGRSRAGQHNVEFSLATIKAHEHIDHVGRIPHLLAAGYNGPICSAISTKLLPLVLEDAFQPGCSRDSKEIARYLKLVEQRLHPLPNNQWFVLLETSQLCVHIHLQRAGHVLGSAYVTIELTYPVTGENKRVVFSGNLCAPHAPLLIPPKSPERADILVLESTYGDRLHEDRASRRQRLDVVIEHALLDQGTALIPAFSIGRTQDLLYELKEIIHCKLQAHINKPPLNVDEGGSEFANNGSSPHSQSPLPSGERARVRSNNYGSEYRLETNWPQLPIIPDSPLATRFTEAYRGLQSYWNQEARERVEGGRNPLAFENLIKIDSHANHIGVLNHLTQTARPAIVIAGNGMCSAGASPITSRPCCTIPGTTCCSSATRRRGLPGTPFSSTAPKEAMSILDDERFDIRAGISSIGGYSAHADQNGLVDFVTGIQQWPTEIRVVHGEQRAKEALAKALKQHLPAPFELKL